MKTIKKILFVLFVCLMNIELTTAQTVVPLNDNGIGDPTSMNGGHNKSPISVPTLYIDGNNLYLVENYSATVCLYASDDDELQNVIYTTFINENGHTVVLPTYLEGSFIIEIIVNNHSFIGYIEMNN